MERRITRVFTGPDNRSHFGELTLPEHEIRSGVSETDWINASRVSLRFLTPGTGFVEQPRHPAPRRQLAIILSGMLEVECGPSEVRRFGPSSIVLLEDTKGEGHVTRVIEAPCSFVQIALDEPGRRKAAP